MNVVEEIALRLDSEEKKYGKASFVVCGGRSVAQVFNKLSLIDINWQNIIITLADNRLVDRNLKDNNETVVFESLLKNHAANAKFFLLIPNYYLTKN